MRAVLTGLASQATGSRLPGALLHVGRSLLGGLATLLDPRFAIIRDRCLHRFDQGRKGRFGVRRHGHVDGLEALVVLIVRLRNEIDGADADQLGIGLYPSRVDADAVLAIVDIRVHCPPIVRELHAENDIGIVHGSRRTPQVMGIREIHSPAMVDDDRLQRLRKLHQQAHAVLGSRYPVDDDDGVFRIGQQPGRFLYRPCVALWR